ncbi:putative disease resistance protein RGA4 isoform X2 [Spinacia oleracea]|nr:putative disease resistance protein RGA4 isoform X2 [Spinacia oleracea]
MSTIHHVLLDAEDLERLHHGRRTNVERGRLKRLKEALYLADDLFDEVTTLAHRKKLMPGNRLTKEVSLFFSSYNQLRSAFTWSREIEKIRELLDDIVKDHHHDSGLRHQHHPVGFEDSRLRYNPRETHSYVCEEEDIIIGRDDDKNIVIDVLLEDTTVEADVSFISIVGIGGLGKTTLAQLVYNDERIEREFPLKMWVCVSDDFNVKVLLGKILAAATNKAGQDCLNMDQLQMKLRQELDGKKYLLVLDDVWNEDCEEWRKLKTLLTGGGRGRGSRILVTTRSNGVADIVGSHHTHELKGLSEIDSWNLFERMILEQGKHQMEAHLVDIGKEIVGKCANVPLAIRVVGSLLRGQGESRWQCLKNTDLEKIKQDGIVPVLKISYYYLPFHLKSCFCYCAIFPKDYKIIKKDLICLWMAQGFIMTSHGKSFEDAGDEYFSDLLQRCFFQDVERAESGEIISCKMHDLIHDVAKEVAGTEIFDATCFNDKTRHTLLDSNSGRNLTNMKRLRTIIILQNNLLGFKLRLFERVLKVRYLRVLDLQYTEMEKLPSMVSELLHLRYLDLSGNLISVLPVSITQLYNLQTLKLRNCWRLKELPRELNKLVNLRHLNMHGCERLTHMPEGMNCMSSLHTLTRFVLGGVSGGSLEDLRDLNNLTGRMVIKVQRGWTYDATQVREGGYLINKQYLRNINIYLCREPYQERYGSDEDSDEWINNSEALMQGLQPHFNLRKFELWFYPGVRFPCWGGSSMNLQSCLPTLVRVQLHKCKRLEHLPLMSQLRHLKALELYELSEVEYMESHNICGDNVGAEDELVFFPSLEKLVLVDLPKLKGWWKFDSESSSNTQQQQQQQQQQEQQQNQLLPELQSYSFPHLSHLIIDNCSSLTTYPVCPKLEKLQFIIGFSDKFSFQFTTPMNNVVRVEIDNINGGYMNSLPAECLQHLSHLDIKGIKNMEELITGEAGEVFRSSRVSSLRSIQIASCSKLKRLPRRGLWEHLTSLKSLQLVNLKELELDDEEEDVNTSNITSNGGYTDKPWSCLAPTLCSLVLETLPKVVKLPKGMHHLTALQSLTIRFCVNLEALPPWIPCLSSLQSLHIWSCRRLESLPEEMRHLTSLQRLDFFGCNNSELKERCRNPTGADWPSIQHIHDINFL